MGRGRVSSMIKLIASDMDGTLLDDAGEVPRETFELIQELKSAGIRFVVTSGRRYDTLQDFFAPIADQIDYVASNGAQVYIRGRLADREVFSHAAVCRLKKLVDEFDTMHLALFDWIATYLLDDEACFERELDKNLPNPVRVLGVPAPEVSLIKASIYCDDALMDMAYVLERELGDEFVFAPSGKKWIDVMQRGVNKATGLRRVMETYGIAADEVMAFGDAMNDYEILRTVGTSVAMGNARSAVKKIATKTVGTNAEHGVQREMARLLDARKMDEMAQGFAASSFSRPMGGNVIRALRASA